MSAFGILGLILMIWMLFGFVSGMKMVYLDDILSEENIDNLIKNSQQDFTDTEIYYLEKLRENKKLAIVAFTLMGLFSFWADTLDTFGRLKK